MPRIKREVRQPPPTGQVHAATVEHKGAVKLSTVERSHTFYSHHAAYVVVPFHDSRHGMSHLRAVQSHAAG